VHEKARKTNAGRKPIDGVMMFKLLVLRTLYNLANELAMGTLRWVHPPKPSRFRTLRGTTDALNPACWALALPRTYRLGAPWCRWISRR